MRKPRIAVGTRALPLAFLITLNGCNPAKGPATALFEDVGAVSKWEESGQIARDYKNPRNVPRYLVTKNRLYLLTQVTQPHLIDVIVVEMPTWRRAELVGLLTKHPELRRYTLAGKWVRYP